MGWPRNHNPQRKMGECCWLHAREHVVEVNQGSEVTASQTWLGRTFVRNQQNQQRFLKTISYVETWGCCNSNPTERKYSFENEWTSPFSKILFAQCFRLRLKTYSTPFFFGNIILRRGFEAHLRMKEGLRNSNCNALAQKIADQLLPLDCIKQMILPSAVNKHAALWQMWVKLLRLYEKTLAGNGLAAF